MAMLGISTAWHAEEEKDSGEVDMDSTSCTLLAILIREHEKEEDDESILGSATLERHHCRS